MREQEVEVKFHVADLNHIESRLQSLGARQTQARLHEVNLRLDTPDLRLTNSHQVLRLRQDDQVRLTYKGPGVDQGGVRVRQEIEFIVSDLEAALHLFSALGYQVAMMYEKYRRVYDLDDVHITLDEMPFGNFVEIEGPQPESILAASQRLGLDWEKRILDSYTTLFDQLRQALGFQFRDLSFENFASYQEPLAELNIRFADA